MGSSRGKVRPFRCSSLAPNHSQPVTTRTHPAQPQPPQPNPTPCSQPTAHVNTRSNHSTPPQQQAGEKMLLGALNRRSARFLRHPPMHTDAHAISTPISKSPSTPAHRLRPSTPCHAPAGLQPSWVGWGQGTGRDGRGCAAPNPGWRRGGGSNLQPLQQARCPPETACYVAVVARCGRAPHVPSKAGGGTTASHPLKTTSTSPITAHTPAAAEPMVA